MKKFVAIIVSISLLIIALSVAYYLVIYIPSSNKTQNKQEPVQLSNITPTQISKKIIPPPTLTQQINPKYTVTILNKPDLYNNFIEINALVKNINITPFITHFTFGDCNFTDDKNNSYTGSSRNSIEFTFSKGLLPNESANVNLKKISIAINGLIGYKDSSFRKCSYDNGGNYVCVAFTGLKIVSCDAYISTDDGWPDTNNKASLLKVEFPN